MMATVNGNLDCIKQLKRVIPITKKDKRSAWSAEEYLKYFKIKFTQ